MNYFLTAILLIATSQASFGCDCSSKETNIIYKKLPDCCCGQSYLPCEVPCCCNPLPPIYLPCCDPCCPPPCPCPSCCSSPCSSCYQYSCPCNHPRPCSYSCQPPPQQCCSISYSQCPSSCLPPPCQSCCNPCPQICCEPLVYRIIQCPHPFCNCKPLCRPIECC